MTNLIDKRKDLVISIIICLSVILFVNLSGTLTSGFHFVDDHEVIRIEHELDQSGFVDVALKWINYDINNTSRFRPLYILHRVFETLIFGSNFTLWSLYHALLFGSTMILFYNGVRRLNFSIVESLIFITIIMIGPQAVVLWRLGPGEILGMFFLSLSILFMPINYQPGRYLYNNLLFVSFMILASLTKESFLIIIPAMIIFKILNEYKVIWKSYRESFRRNSVLILLVLVFIAEILFIKYKVGLVNSAAGSGIGFAIRSSANTVLHFIYVYRFLIISVIFIFIADIYVTRNLFLNEYSMPILVFILILLPNSVLYSGTGLVERYLIPSTMGLGFLTIFFLKRIRTVSSRVSTIALILVLVSCITFFRGVFNDAYLFALEGRSTGELLRTISENNHPEATALAVADPVEDYEYSVSLKTYLKLKESMDLYGYPISAGNNNYEIDEYMAGWKSYFEGRVFDDSTKVPDLIVFFDKSRIDTFFQKSSLRQRDYNSILSDETTHFALLKRNDFKIY